MGAAVVGEGLAGGLRGEAGWKDAFDGIASGKGGWSLGGGLDGFEV